MKGLLDAATVLEGDGSWTSTNYGVDALACGRSFEAVDLCTPGDPVITDESETGFQVYPFAIVGSQKFPVRCSPGDAESALGQSMADATEYEVARAFWAGQIPDWEGDLFVTNTQVDTVNRGSNNIQITAAALLKHAFDKNPDITPIVHLGFLSAFQLGPSKIDDLDFEYVISPGYPVDALAVTGPIVVRLGSIETLNAYDTSVNRKYITATRIAAVEFDPCLAVRAV